MSLPSERIRFCTSRDGTRIAYATCGAGPPLLWIAPFGHHLKLDWESPIWRPWLSLLMRRYCLVRYDWRGCGLSDRDGVEISSERLIEDLEAVVEAAGLQRFALFGHEGGGMTCVAYTVRHPEQVSHLLLNACPTRGRLARASTPEQIEYAKTRLRMIELGSPNETPEFGQFHSAMHMPDASTEQRRSYNELLRLTTNPANASGLIRTFMTTDVRDLVPKIRCPTLVLQSRKESIVPFDEGRTMAAMIAGAQFVPLESRNHILVDTEPAWEQLMTALDDFLPASPGVPPSLLDDLSSREREVLEFVAQGLDNSRISMQLKISEKTVRNHVSTIFSKLGVTSRAQAVAVARDAGFGRRTVR